MPRAERPVPPYAQIANYYRAEITESRLRPGERLPAIAAIAEEWGVATTTAAKAIGLLQVEGLIYTSPQGSFVSDPRGTSRTPKDTVTASPVHRIGTNGETVTVNAAGAVPAPAYVAEILGIEPGEEIIRREEILYHGSHARALTVDWIPATNVMQAAALVEAVPIPGGAITLIETVTNRRPTYGRDYVRGRAADAREAGALKLPVGAPILAGTHVWSDEGGVILYGEWCMPPDQVISYDYAVPGGEDEPAE
jgi:GntR family transcriptional regulator